jgi:hypothetical protein
MVNADEVRRLALALPEVTADSQPDRLSATVAGKAVAWTYFERVEPNKPRRPRSDVVAVRCSLEKKEMLIEAAPDTYFDDDHYRGFPAVLVRLAAIDTAELDALLRSAWTIQAPKRLRKQS